MGFALQDGGGDAYVLTNAAHLYWDKAREAADEPSRSSEWQRAVEYGEKALQIDGGTLEGGYFLALAYKAQGKIDKAVVLLSDLYRKYPTDVRLNMELGRMLASTKEPSRAVPYLQRVIAWDHGYARRQQAKNILIRPLTLYDGPQPRDYVPLEER